MHHRTTHREELLHSARRGPPERVGSRPRPHLQHQPVAARLLGAALDQRLQLLSHERKHVLPPAARQRCRRGDRAGGRAGGQACLRPHAQAGAPQRDPRRLPMANQCNCDWLERQDSWDTDGLVASCCVCSCCVRRAAWPRPAAAAPPSPRMHWTAVPRRHRRVNSARPSLLRRKKSLSGGSSMSCTPMMRSAERPCGKPKGRWKQRRQAWNLPLPFALPSFEKPRRAGREGRRRAGATMSCTRSSAQRSAAQSATSPSPRRPP